MKKIKEYGMMKTVILVIVMVFTLWVSGVCAEETTKGEGQPTDEKIDRIYKMLEKFMEKNPDVNSVKATRNSNNGRNTLYEHELDGPSDIEAQRMQKEQTRKALEDMIDSIVERKLNLALEKKLKENLQKDNLSGSDKKILLKLVKDLEGVNKKATKALKLSLENQKAIKELNNRFDSIEADTKKYKKYMNVFAKIYKRKPNSLEIGWFDNGSAVVTKEMTEKLVGLVNGFTKEIIKGKTVHMRFEGFSDKDGTTKRNDIVSKQRAENAKAVVKAYIERKNIKKIVLGEALGKGKTEQKKQGQKYNRFVRVYFDYQN